MIRVVSVLTCAVVIAMAGTSLSGDMLARASGDNRNTESLSSKQFIMVESPGNTRTAVFEPGRHFPATNPVDTLHWDGPNDDAVGLTGGGRFYGAVRFTPIDDYTLTNVLWYSRDEGSSAEIRIWSQGDDFSPGELLETVSSDIAQEEWINIDMPPVELLAGQDFWVGVVVEHVAGKFPLGVDAGPQERRRGGYVSTDGSSWQELYEVGLNCNWNIRAVAELKDMLSDDVGVTTIFSPTGTIPVGNLTPRVQIRNFGSEPQTDIPVHIRIDQAGADVFVAEATYAGPLASRTSVEVSFAQDWDATEGDFTVTSWTLLDGDERPANDSTQNMVSVRSQITDTLHWDDGRLAGAIGLQGGGPIYGAVRFTPEVAGFTLTNVLWYNMNRATGAEVLIWGPGSSTAPGNMIEVVQSDVGEDKLVNVATPPIELPAGQDFWVGVRAVHRSFTAPLGTDGGPQKRQRGGFVSSDGIRWNELYQIGRDNNLIMRAIVQTGVGVKAELSPADPVYVRCGPNPITGGTATLRYSLPQAGPARVTMFDVTGRTVFRRSIAATRTGRVSLDLHSLSAGIYLVRMDAEGFSANQKLVVQK